MNLCVGLCMKGRVFAFVRHVPARVSEVHPWQPSRALHGPFDTLSCCAICWMQAVVVVSQLDVGVATSFFSLSAAYTIP